MYLPEYTAIHRAAKIFRILQQDSSASGNYYSVIGQELRTMMDAKIPSVSAQDTTSLLQWVHTQQALEDILQYSIPGCQIKRYVSVTTRGSEGYHILPFFCCELFDPCHSYMIVTLTSQGAIVISPYNNPELAKESGNEYIAELLPLDFIREFSILSSPEEKVQKLQEEEYFTIPATEDTDEIKMTIGKYVFTTAVLYSVGIQKQDEVLQAHYGTVEEENITVVGAESEWFLAAKRQFGLEELQQAMGDYETGPIPPTDFIPMVVTQHTENEYGDPNNPGTILLRIKQKDDNTYIRTLTLHLHNSGDFGTAMVPVVDSDRSSKGAIVECSAGYVVGDHLILLHEGAITDCIPVVGNVVDIPTEANLMPVPAVESYGASFEERIAMETSFKDAVNAVKRTAKKAGVHSSDFLSKIGGIAKLPAKAAIDMMKATTRVFKRSIDFEKEETLAMREKLLNDEMDVTGEKFLFWAQTISLSGAISFILGNWFLGIFGFLLAKSKVKKSKLKAIERLEMKLDHAIERLDVKIEHARGESDYKGVDALLREKELYEQARFKLKDMKTDLVKEKSIKYVTYDADLGLSPRERLEKAYQQDRPVDLRHNYR